jgi:hypothetical protein
VPRRQEFSLKRGWGLETLVAAPAAPVRADLLAPGPGRSVADVEGLGRYVPNGPARRDQVAWGPGLTLEAIFPVLVDLRDDACVRRVPIVNANAPALLKQPGAWHQEVMLPVRGADYPRPSPTQRPFVPQPEEAEHG